MAWIRSDVAGEVAVLSAWLSALVPWSVTYQPSAPPVGMPIYLARFGLFGLQIRPEQIVLVDGREVPITQLFDLFFPGSHLVGSVYATTPPTATAFYRDLPETTATTAAGSSLFWAGLAWTLGAIVVVLALGLSVALLLDEERTAAALPVDYVRAMGGLLALSCIALAVATALFFVGRSVVGVPIPVGLLVVGALAVALLRVERV